MLDQFTHLYEHTVSTREDTFQEAKNETKTIEKNPQYPRLCMKVSDSRRQEICGK